MTKVLVMKNGSYAIVAPNGVKGFVTRFAALYAARESVQEQMKYSGEYTESLYRKLCPVKSTFMVE